MPDAQSVLIAVDDSDPSRNAVAYVARMLGGTDRFQIHLLHVLPPIPTGLLEHGGRTDPKNEEAAGRELDALTAEWRKQREQEAAPMMNSMKEVLEAAGTPGDRIEIAYKAPLPEESVGERILAGALERSVGTVVVGRAPRGYWAELFHRHPSGALLRRHSFGFAVWLVE